MADSTSNLDLISSSQAAKEVTANALFDAASVSTLFGRRASMTTALTWAYYGGIVVVAGTPTEVANGTIALTASQTNYIEYNPATGMLVKNTTGWSAASLGYARVYKVVADASTVTSYEDWRFQGIGAPIAQFPMQYIGTWNASTNTPTLAAGTGTKGYFYKVSVAGTQDLGNGATLFTANDSVVYNGSTWDKLEGGLSSAEVVAALGYTPENAANKDASGGYAGLDLFKLKLRNAANTFTSFLTNAATAARTWTMPDKDGTVAMTNDKLSVFSATTSAELASVVSDETGSGALVFANGPTFTGEVTLPGNPTLPLHAIPLQTLELYFARTNDIGTPGHPSFGVGVCPQELLPAGFSKLAGTDFPVSDEYGNYQYSDGSIMVWIPAFYYKYGTGSNGLAVNQVDIKGEWYFADVTDANAAGYALHRAFYDGGLVQRGVFVDKYKCSNNAGTASSIRNANPLSSAATNEPFSGLTGAPANAYYGAIAAAKTRGANFFPASLFVTKALALLALAHAQNSASTTWCAWYHATNNFPKGCNNNALGDVNDAALTFTWTGNATYLTANKTGSANVLAKTTHNGQNCGIADVNGTTWDISLGLTSDAINYYILKTTAAMKNITAGNTLATDAWGTAGIAALYDDLGTTFGALWATGANRVAYFGSATQVFDAATSGNAWNAAGAGIPLAGGVGGTNAFGNDGLWDYKPNEMCPIVGGNWANGSPAGAWALYLSNARSNSDYSVGLRAALYL